MVSLFIRPAPEVYSGVADGGYLGFETYSQYNYLRPGLISWIKRRRFEIALQMSRQWFGDANAIDFGCADGVLIPSLSQHFRHVTAIDSSERFIKHAQMLVERLDIKNVSLICNNGTNLSELRQALGERRHRVMFLLETLEHLGTPGPGMYQSKVEFVADLFSLLEPDGVIIVSVPRMIGLPYLVKYSIQSIARMPHETHSFKPLLRASFLNDTSQLEPMWQHGHMGFNHLKLEHALTERFNLSVRRSTFASMFYVIRNRLNGDAPSF